MTPWSVHRIADIFGDESVAHGLPDGRWVTAVSVPYPGGRLRAAWMVLTGRAYALEWPEAGDLERVLGGVIIQNRRPARAPLNPRDGQSRP